MFKRRVDAATDVLNLRPVESGGEMVAIPKVPDFLAVYGAELDAFGHAEGAESPNLGPLVAELDRQLGRLVQATREAGIYDRTAFVLTGDHGMTTWYRSLTEKLGAVTILGRRPEILPAGKHASPEAEVVIVTAGRVADVTLQRRTSTPQGRKRARAAFEGMDEISRVLDASDFGAFHAGGKLGDFVLEARAPWGFGPPGSDKGSPRGGHGSTREIRVPLLISGAGLRAGGVAREPHLVDVAPTISALLGVRPPADAQGRALDELLN